QYLPYAKPRKRSYRRDEEMYRLRIKENFGRMKLNEVTRKQVQLFHNRLVAEGLMPASADHYLKLLRQAWNLAVEWEVLDSSPLTRLQLFNPDNRIEHYLSPADLEKLLNVLRTAPSRTVCNVALFLLSTVTGNSAAFFPAPIVLSTMSSSNHETRRRPGWPRQGKGRGCGVARANGRRCCRDFRAAV
ncbi:MAG: hypothetical protein WBO95_14235, partial [Candidatus Dechloromonas phosphoritropha]